MRIQGFFLPSNFTNPTDADKKGGGGDWDRPLQPASNSICSMHGKAKLTLTKC